MGRWGDGEMGRWGDGEMGRWGDGEMGRWGDGEMGRWGDGEMGRWGVWGVGSSKPLTTNVQTRCSSRLYPLTTNNQQSTTFVNIFLIELLLLVLNPNLSLLPIRLDAQQ